MLDTVELNKLKWRCRRGLLENDLFIERVFRRHAETLTVGNGEIGERSGADASTTVITKSVACGGTTGVRNAHSATVIGPVKPRIEIAATSNRSSESESLNDANDPLPANGDVQLTS